VNHGLDWMSGLKTRIMGYPILLGMICRGHTLDRQINMVYTWMTLLLKTRQLVLMVVANGTREYELHKLGVDLLPETSAYHRECKSDAAASTV